MYDCAVKFIILVGVGLSWRATSVGTARGMVALGVARSGADETKRSQHVEGSGRKNLGPYHMVIQA